MDGLRKFWNLPWKDRWRERQAGRGPDIYKLDPEEPNATTKEEKAVEKGTVPEVERMDKLNSEETQEVLWLLFRTLGCWPLKVDGSIRLVEWSCSNCSMNRDVNSSMPHDKKCQNGPKSNRYVGDAYCLANFNPYRIPEEDWETGRWLKDFADRLAYLSSSAKR